MNKRSVFMKKNKNKATRKMMQQKKKLLMEDITKTRRALETAYANFQYVSDPVLIDCYIYEINSADLRYKYLLNEMRLLSLTENAV